MTRDEIEAYLVAELRLRSQQLTGPPTAADIKSMLQEIVTSNFTQEIKVSIDPNNPNALLIEAADDAMGE